MYEQKIRNLYNVYFIYEFLFKNLSTFYVKTSVDK